MLVVNADFSGPHHKATPPTARPYDGPEASGITFGPYYTFEHLTLCPIITSPVIRDMLTDEELEWFNRYQQTVYERLNELYLRHNGDTLSVMDLESIGLKLEFLRRVPEEALFRLPAEDGSPSLPKN